MRTQVAKLTGGAFAALVIFGLVTACGGSKPASGPAVAANPHMKIVGGLCQGAPTKEKAASYFPNAYVHVRNTGKQTGKAYVGVQFKTGAGDRTYSTSLAGGGTATATIPPGQSRKVHVFAPSTWQGFSLLASQGDSCQAKIVGTNHWKSLAMAPAW